jgi:hypothetical protein
MSRRRHHERHRHYGVHVRWHEYRRTTGDVKTSVVRRGMNIDQPRGVIPHWSTGYHWVTEEAYAIQSASFRTGVKEMGSVPFSVKIDCGIISMGSYALNRGHTHHRLIRRCRVREGCPRRFGSAQRDNGP